MNMINVSLITILWDGGEVVAGAGLSAATADASYLASAPVCLGGVQ